MPRFWLFLHAMPMNTRLVRGWDEKSVNWEVAINDLTLESRTCSLSYNHF